MNRRAFILSSVGLAICAATPAVAGLSEAEVSKQLSAQGYTLIGTKKTWLGRIKITAVRGKKRREIVLDPTTGEILRDYTEREDKDRSGGSPEKSSEGTGGGETGGGETGGSETGGGETGGGETGGGETGEGGGGANTPK